VLRIGPASLVFPLSERAPVDLEGLGELSLGDPAEPPVGLELFREGQRSTRHLERHKAKPPDNPCPLPQRRCRPPNPSVPNGVFVHPELFRHTALP